MLKTPTKRGDIVGVIQIETIFNSFLSIFYSSYREGGVWGCSFVLHWLKIGLESDFYLTDWSTRIGSSIGRL